MRKAARTCSMAAGGRDPPSAIAMLASAFSGLVVPMMALWTPGRLSVKRSARLGHACSGEAMKPESFGFRPIWRSRSAYVAEYPL